MNYREIVIWYNPTKKTYYYKKSKGTYQNYYVGYKNQYNHEVVLLIDVYEDLIAYKKNRYSVKHRLIDKLQKCLDKMR